MRGIFKRAVVLGLVLALMLSACAAALAVDPPKTDSQLPAVVPLFPDVKAADGNAVFINYAAKRDLIKGFPDGGFHPAEALTRAQAAVLLVKAGGIKTGTKQTTTFKDVPASHWAFASIAAASEAGYLKGFPDGTFKPEQKLSRAQGISLFLRLSKQRMDQAELPALLDMSKDHWAAPSVATALEAKMIGLSSDKKNFYPDADLSRGDLARALAILLTKDPGLYQTPLSPSLSVKSGDVKIGSANASGAAVLKTGDIIDTGDKGEAEITFPDGSGLLLKSNTILVIKESKGRAYIKADGNPGTAVESLNVELKQGKIFGALASRINANPETARADDLRGKISSLVASLGDRLARMLAANDKEAPWYKTAEQKKVKVKVDMPWGIAAIRGSFWSNTVSSSSCSTSLLEGDASMTAGGGSQSLAPGQASTVGSAGGTPSVPTVMSASEKSAWAQEKGWVQSRAEAIQNNQESIQTQIAPGEKAAIPSTSIVETVNQALSQAQTGAVPTTPASGGTGGGGSYTPYVSISGLSDVSMSVYSATYQTVSFTTSPTADVVTAVYGTPGIVCLGTPTINSLDIYPITAGKTTVTITASKTGYTNGSGTFNVTVYNPLGQVTGVAWQPSPNCRKISWNTVPNASGYLVKLLKGAAVVYQTTVASSSWEADFTTQINNDIIANGAGAYTAKVTAVGSMTAPDYYGNGPESAASSPRSFLAQVGTPTWTSSNQISWNDVSNATCYTASLYQDGGTTAIETQNISPGVQTCTFAGVSTGHTYTATVQAVGDGTSYFDGPISAQSGAKTLLGQVTGLSWSGTNLNWTALTTAPSSYEVKLYKVGTPDTLSGTFSTSGTTKDLSSSLTVPGEYYATVQAKGNGSDMVDGQVSAASTHIIVLDKVATPTWTAKTRQLNWGSVAGASSYQVVLTGPSGTKTYSFAGSPQFIPDSDMSAAGAYTATVQAISNNPAYLNGPASDSSTPMTVLNKVAKPTWTTDTGIINWVDVDNETSYTVTLLKDGAPLETVTKTAGSISHPFGGTIALNGAGNYSVTVQAINSGTDYIDGLASDASEERTVVQLDLGADPWWGGITGHVIYWNNIDNETGYQVILKKDGNVVECQNIESTTAYWYDFDYRMNGVTGSFTVDVKALGNGTNYANSIPRTSAAHVH